ncbi:sensor histidine kinase [Microbacterium esteraromaticum]|uniref:sensor histidine kinase n=1 Tax=Microbacterium esteraromaticum TaxID=57043 RepID=UPI001CD55788|nr:sensor histidine kinase [Microbacterium esteraromaticum]MCA1307239.1 sensor histidine kinase [Microbacterium esteraromaticum]
MSVVSASLNRPDPPGATHTAAPGTGAAVRAMEIGQYLMVLLLTVIGVVRAVGDGVAVAVAIITGAAIIAWHVAGAVLLARAPSRALSIGWLLGLAAVWVGAVAVSAEFVWLAFLLWLLAGHLLSLRWGLVFSGVVLSVVVVAPILHHGTTTYATVFGPLIGGVFAFGISRGYLQLLKDAAERERLVASLTRAQHEMAELQDELADAQRTSGAIAERTRISRDIHDTVAQEISSIRLLAHAAMERSDDPDAIRVLAQIEQLAGESQSDIRRIVEALAPAELDDDALAAALRRMLDRMHAETGLQTDLHVDDTLPVLPTEAEVALLRVAQSGLANVRLHSHATRVVMSLIDAEDAVRLDIIDDGTGFDLVAWEADADAGASSYGLRFMRARLRELGGGLDIESTPGEGTAISAHLPVSTSTRHHESRSQEETP